MDDVGEAYTAVAGQYIELFGNTSSVHSDDMALIERHLTIRAGAVLDLGCGPGRLTAHLVARGVTALGLDLAAVFVEHGQSMHASGRFVRGALHRLPFRDTAASGILAWYSLIHVPPAHIDDVLTEMRRVAAAGSTLVVGFFDGDEVAEFPHKVSPAHLWPVDELSSRLTRCGFSEVDRVRRPADPEMGTRPHGAIVAVAA